MYFWSVTWANERPLHYARINGELVKYDLGLEVMPPYVPLWWQPRATYLGEGQPWIDNREPTEFERGLARLPDEEFQKAIAVHKRLTGQEIKIDILAIIEVRNL